MGVLSPHFNAPHARRMWAQHRCSPGGRHLSLALSESPVCDVVELLTELLQGGCAALGA